MRLVIQRCVSGCVTLLDDASFRSSIARGAVVLVGFDRADRRSACAYLAKKIVNLRLFDDEEGKAWMQSVVHRQRDLLLVSQFTLYAVTKGNKPDFHNAMGPAEAQALYDEFVRLVREEYQKSRKEILKSSPASSSLVDLGSGTIGTGQFGGDMQVALVNDGPVTICLDTDGVDFTKENEKEDKQKKWTSGKGGAPAAAKPSDAAGAASEPTANGSPAAASPTLDASPTMAASPSPAPSASPAPAPSTKSNGLTAEHKSSSDRRKGAGGGGSAGSKLKGGASSSPAPAPAPDTAVSYTTSPDSPFYFAALPPLPSAYPILPPSPQSSPTFASLVGNTSLVYLRGPSALTGCAIYGKAEYENPGGSIKDRAACAILSAAEKAGELHPGRPGWIVEGTAGNTGIGLTLQGAARGYRTLIVMAANNSQEKKDLLRALGATLLEVPMVPFSNRNNYVHVAKRVYECMKAEFAQPTSTTDDVSRPRVILADQWSNHANRQAHYATTGPEIWRQTDGGRIDAFACGVGTGGTLSGVSMFLRSKKAEEENQPKEAAATADNQQQQQSQPPQSRPFQSFLIDPDGSALKSYFETGQLTSSGESIAEGIGQGRLCDNLTRDGFRPDGCLRVTDRAALEVAFDLLEQEGLSIGTSSAVNVAGAIAVARQMGPGHTIVTVLCDAGTRYQSKMYNETFLRAKGLPVPEWVRTIQAKTMDAASSAADSPSRGDDSASSSSSAPSSSSSLSVESDRTRIAAKAQEWLKASLLVDEAPPATTTTTNAPPPAAAAASTNA